ncbi:transcriptional regulator [Gordonia sp. JH63]|uniref:Helix-turn-helix transcriptional regulator n=1 Tax=Gordonia hongkongensis TaxID=1701090 RepID=A0ABT6BZ28_9ACTN|nr:MULTISPECIES: helix-turn-helix domain-containing protein [Gordonia]MCZ4535919.1 helix-turn-helix domain-containing protein [Gordonia terrae]MBN0971100.1 helix-turn-helix transcriptional regulator [Gordonia sp. BP-119]MBN0982320.1 helix-turn-helix transcriptional regulator [Gordonia sp. BP-94]MDF6102940.1 helix-turn-helix transcriptional regulator [Gordonia hongkongensis]OCH80651.1 HxlR family transcriptional regulator [Gordonia sp. UCD-TK1]
MRRASFAEMNCSIAQTLEIVGEWWTLLIVRDAMFGVTRFDEFSSRLGIARNVLTQRLDTLVEHEILAKEPYQDNPVRYDYRLTEKGRDLWTVLAALRQWGDRWTAEDGAPVVSTHSCGQTMTVEPTCSACGERIGTGELRVHPGPGATTDNPLAGLR